MDSKLGRVAPLTWRPWQSSSARRAELSVGAPCPGGRTRCPPARAAGAARSCASGTGCGAETGPAASATSALESDLVLQHGGHYQSCSRVGSASTSASLHRSLTGLANADASCLRIAVTLARESRCLSAYEYAGGHC